MLLLIFSGGAGAPGGGIVTIPDAFPALLDRAVADWIVLAEVQPMEILGAWTAAGGGLTQTYYCSFPTQVATDVVPGGLYRRLDVVRQDALPLAVQTSAANVNASLGSYYLDLTLGRLYVSTTGALPPDSYALLGAWFTLFFSTTSVPFTDQPLYSPLLTGVLPTLSAEMPDSLFGATVSDTGDLALLNGDKLFDKLAKRYVWANKFVTLKLVSASTPSSTFGTIDTLRINAIAVTDEVASLRLEDTGSILNQSLPRRTWGDGSTNAHGPVPMVSDALGRSQPLVFGTVATCPFVLASNTPPAVNFPTFPGVPGSEIVESSIWLAYDFNAGPYGFCQIRNVIAIDRTSQFMTALANGVHYIISGATVTVIDPAYTADTHDLVGELANIAFTTSAGFGAMARAILELCGATIDQLDVDAFAAANLAAPQVLARWVGTPVQAADLMRELEQSVNGQVYKGIDGRWTCRVLTPDLPPAPVEISDPDVVSWNPAGDLATTLNTMRVRWGHQPLTDNWFEVSASDDTVRYSAETSDSHRIDTWLTTDGDASALAQHLRFFHSAPPMVVRSEQRGLELLSAHVGDLVSVRRVRAPVARTGTYESQLLRILQIDKVLGGDTPTVAVTISDLDGQADRIFRLVDTAITWTWATATADQRARYGFLADTNRYLDPVDAGTRDLKVLW